MMAHDESVLAECSATDCCQKTTIAHELYVPAMAGARYIPALLLAVYLPVSVFAADVPKADDDKCSPSAWLALDSEYMQALRASDIGRLQSLKVKRAQLLQECNRPVSPGAASSTGSGDEPYTPGPPNEPDSPVSGGGGDPGDEPYTPGLPIEPVPTGGDDGGPDDEPITPGPLTEPDAPQGGKGEAPGDEPGTPGLPPVSSSPEATSPTDALSAEEQARKKEWDKRQEFAERMLREQAALTEANKPALVSVWSDFWSSVRNGGKITPVEPLRPPSFEELLSRGDPLATRLQEIRNEVGNGAPTQQQLDEMRALSRAAQQGQQASGVAIVKTNATAANIAQAGEVVSQIGASAGQAAAEFVLVNAGVPKPIANAATTAIYDGLQHYDKGVVAVITHGATSAATGALGTAASGRVGKYLDDAATSVGGRILQGVVGGAVSGSTGSVGHTVLDGKEVKAGDVIQATVVGGAIGGVLNPVAGAINDAKVPVGSGSSGTPSVTTTPTIKPVPTVSDIDVETAIGVVIKPVVGAATSSSEGAVPDKKAVKPRIKLPETLPEE